MQLNSGSDRENRNGRQRSKSRRLINVQLYLATLLHRAFIAGNTATSSFHCRQHCYIELSLQVTLLHRAFIAGNFPLQLHFFEIVKDSLNETESLHAFQLPYGSVYVLPKRELLARVWRLPCVGCSATTYCVCGINQCS